MPDGWLGVLQRTVSAVGDYLGEHPEGGDPALRDFLFEALAFARLAERFGDHSLCELRRRGRGQAELGIRNLVPADFLAPRFASAYATILFSATLSPPEYHCDLLGLPADSVVRRVPSPFDAEQLEVRCRADISTRLKDREASLGRSSRSWRPVPSMAGTLPGLLQQLCLSRVGPGAARSRAPEDTGESPAAWHERAGARGLSGRLRARRQWHCLRGAWRRLRRGYRPAGRTLGGGFCRHPGLPPLDPINEALKHRLQARFGRGDDYAYRVPG